ncbi:MAG TPA: hypothetical protein VKY41_04765 [Xanthomarina sp.]|nr:hypothetical protein [Xanthomarina sp.]
MIEDLEKCNNLEAIGKNYFKLGMKHTLKKSFDKAYEYFKAGLNSLTCDCIKDKWIISHGQWDYRLFHDMNYSFNDPSAYYFVKAFLLINYTDKKFHYLALDAIEKYLDIQVDEYGLYVQGKIYNRLEYYFEAYKCFDKAIKIKNLLPIKYRQGRLDVLTFEGSPLEINRYFDCVDKLCDSLLLNPSSACCARELKNNWRIDKNFDEFMRYEIKSNSNYYNNNKLIDLFISEDNTEEFESLYKELIKKEISLRVSDLISANSDFSNFISLIYSVKGLCEGDIYLDKNGDFGGYKSDFDLSHEREDNSWFENPYYNDQLDMDQQDPEFWDNL